MADLTTGEIKAAIACLTAVLENAKKRRELAHPPTHAYVS